MTYLIIQDKTIHHEGDDRSRNYPGHGYPAWSETVQMVTYYNELKDFEIAYKSLTSCGKKFRAFGGTEYEIVTKMEVTIKEKK